jgi:hypothetical protein
MEHGDLVLCVCDYSKFVNRYDLNVNYPIPGQYYTIREIKTITNGKELITLEEITNNKVLTIEGKKEEICFEGLCFVKMPTPDISELTNLLK